MQGNFKGHLSETVLLRRVLEHLSSKRFEALGRRRQARLNHQGCPLT